MKAAREENTSELLKRVWLIDNQDMAGRKMGVVWKIGLTLYSAR